jgi:hypothetical protein
LVTEFGTLAEARRIWNALGSSFLRPRYDWSRWIPSAERVARGRVKFGFATWARKMRTAWTLLSEDAVRLNSMPA